MRTYTYSIADDRYATPTLEYVMLMDMKHARALAAERLILSAHHRSIAIIEGGVELYRIGRGAKRSLSKSPRP